MTTDKVGDFIIRLQNASMIGRKTASLPYSTHLESIARKLKTLGFVAEVAVDTKDEKGIKKNLVVTLAYDARGKSKIHGVKRISKPGRRLYIHATEAHSVEGGTGARIISTPSGILSDRDARAAHVGGEHMFEIW